MWCGATYLMILMAAIIFVMVCWLCRKYGNTDDFVAVCAVIGFLIIFLAVLGLISTVISPQSPGFWPPAPAAQPAKPL